MKNRIIPIEKLEGLMWKPGEELPPSPRKKGENSSGSGSVGDFCIEELEDRYVLKNVAYDDGVHSFGIMKNLLDGGNSHNPDDWIGLTKDSEAKLASVPDWFAIMFALYDNKQSSYSSLVEKIKVLLADDFSVSKPYAPTSTRVTYNSTGKDIVTHNKGYETEFTVEEDIAGNNMHVEVGLENVVKALCGTDDIAKVKEAVKWLTGKETYLWRMNKPAQGSEERAVVLGVGNGDDFVIYAYVSRPARGVVASRENFP